MEKTGVKIIAKNKKAYHDYFILDTLETGIELFGTEVKSVRAGSVNLKDAFCSVTKGEMFAHGIHISPYEKGNIFNKNPLRDRKLLLHRREIDHLYGKVKQDGCALVPLSIYLKGSLVKVELALCKGKKNYDKRDAAAERDSKRDIDRAMKSRSLGGRDSD